MTGAGDFLLGGVKHRQGEMLIFWLYNITSYLLTSGKHFDFMKPFNNGGTARYTQHQSTCELKFKLNLN